MNTQGVLFVCLGNICRSPLAEAMFTQHARKAGLHDRLLIDSCGMGHWHVGEPPDPRARAVAERHGIPMNSIARRYDPDADPERFHWIIAMDRSNRRALLAEGAPPDHVHLMRSFDPDLARTPESQLDVPDPYYGGDQGFTDLLRMLDRAVAGLTDTVSQHLRAHR